MLWFTLSVLLLTLLLFFPMSRIIWVLSVRRIQKRERRELDEREVEGQLQRARFIAVLIALVFSFLFNYRLIGFPSP